MKVWIVWQDVNDWPESGGGAYVEDIFKTEEEANAFCEKKNHEETHENTSYFVKPWEVR